ncbi:MAG: hypothetical protein K5917_07070 [Clostridiales bacterium]|nr:hypothetical protein [Clostridiales bacterium]
MKSKVMKKVISVAIALVMIFSMIPMAFAADNNVPVVIVPGMGAIDLVYLNVNGESTGTAVFPPNIANSIVEIIQTVLTLAFPEKDTVDVNAVYNYVKQIADSMLAPLSCDENGLSVYSVGVAKTWKTGSTVYDISDVQSCATGVDAKYLTSRDSAEPAVAKAICDSVGAENVFIYKYDWRMTNYDFDGSGNLTNYPRELNAYIKAVKAQTGASKVKLVSGSMGTALVSQYVNEYKSDATADVERCIFLSAAYQGTTLVGQIMSGNLDLKKDNVKRYLSSMDLGIVNMLLNGSLYDALSALLSSKKAEIYSDILYKYMKNIPGLWAVMNGADVAAAKSAAGIKADTGIAAFIDRYFTAQNAFKSNMTALKSAGVDFAVVAQYGFAGIPVTTNGNYYTDNLIDVKYASAGATVAAYGEELSSGSQLSPDKRIDASTCLFPSNTWFIKGLGHMGYSTKVKTNEDKTVDTSSPYTVDLIAWLVSAASVPTIASDAKYPQFMYSNKDNQLLTMNDALASDYATALNEANVEQKVAQATVTQTVVSDSPAIEVVSANVSETAIADNDYTVVAVLASIAVLAIAVAGAYMYFKKAKVTE